MKYSPTVSVIVPVYNDIVHLEECIDSILSQTYPNIEIIIVDDGSTDGTSDMCDRLSICNSRVIVIHKQNGGISSARNAGLEVASGDYVGYVDSDDVLLPQMYELLLNSIQKNEGCKVAVCGVLQLSDGKTEPYRKKWNRETSITYSAEEYMTQMLSYVTSNSVWNKLFDMKTIKGIRFLEGRINEDSLYMFEVLKNLNTSGGKIYEVPDSLYIYRVNPDGITHTRQTQLLLDQNRNLEYLVKESEQMPWEETSLRAFLFDTLSLSHRLALLPDHMNEYYETSKKLKICSFWYVLRISNLRNAILFQFIKEQPLAYRRLLAMKSRFSKII